MGCLSSKPEVVAEKPVAEKPREKSREEILASLSPEDREAELEIENVFALFSKIDIDKSGGVDKQELADALEQKPRLRKRLCENTGIAYDEDNGALASNQLASKIIDKIDDDADGVVKPIELERAIRGWANIDYDPVADQAERDRQNQLKGAAERAKIRSEMHGGFAGVTDANEAMAIGVNAQRLTQKSRDAAFGDSAPEVFGNGAEYVKSPELKARRASMEKHFEEEARAQKLLNKVGEDFKGHDEATARAQAESVVLGGVEVAIDGEDERRKKKMPAKLVKRMKEESAKRGGEPKFVPPSAQ